jgi:acyl-coenzyme A synthetase/AMP-(fatty) acid ligase
MEEIFRMNATDEILRSPYNGDRGDATALLWRGGQLTYVELTDMVNRVGNGLRANGVVPENRVLLLLKDTPEFVFAFLGAMKIGAVAVPLNTRCSAGELLFAINDSRCKALLIDQDFLGRFAQIEADVDHEIKVVVAGPEYGAYANLRTFAMSQSPVLEAVPMSPDDMAYWIYTAGATSAPKAAVHVQHDVRTSDVFVRETLGLTAADRLFSTSRLFNPYAMGTCLFGGLRIGASVIVDAEWPHAASVFDVIERLRPTAFFSVPKVYRSLVRAQLAAREAIGAIRCFVSGGELLPASIRADWETATNRAIVECYGTAESSFVIFADGKPVPGVSVELRDEFGTLLLESERDGELWVKMPSMADRYWNRQERTAVSSREGWWRTNDTFRVSRAGVYSHRGRTDDMLRISGQWVSPREIEEEVLLAGDVSDCAAVAVADDDALPRLVLYVVALEAPGNHAALQRALVERLSQRLAVYKCPREIRFVEAIPRAATGNIQRFRLREGDVLR